MLLFTTANTRRATEYQSSSLQPQVKGFLPSVKLTPAPERQGPGLGYSAPSFKQPRSSTRANPRCVGSRQAAHEADRSPRPHLALPHCRAQWPYFQWQTSTAAESSSPGKTYNNPTENRLFQPLANPRCPASFRVYRRIRKMRNNNFQTLGTRCPSPTGSHFVK